MPPIINTGLIDRQINSLFHSTFSAELAKTLYEKWTTRVASTGDGEKYRWLGTVPQMREWGTGRVVKGLRSESYDVDNLKYEATLEVDRDELADDRTGQILARVKELAVRAATHKDKMVGDLLINGATTGFNSYDGVSFFNDAHVSGASGSQDNDLAPAAADANAPTTGEFKTALTAAIAAMLDFKDDQGEPAHVDMASLVCVVPASMVFTAREAVGATIIANTTNVIAGIADVVPFTRLSAASTWYLLKTDGVVRPFIFQDREPIEFKKQAEGSSEEFMREKYLYGVRARYRITYGYWQHAIRSVFA